MVMRKLSSLLRATKEAAFSAIVEDRCLDVSDKVITYYAGKKADEYLFRIAAAGGNRESLRRER